MTADMRYVFGSIRSGAIIAEIPLFSVYITRHLNDDGTLQGTFNLDQTGYSNQAFRDATIPGYCYVVAERNGTPIWGGMVWARTLEAQSKTVELYCKSYEAYPTYVFMDDYNKTNTDQVAIFQDLWTTLQGHAGCDLSVDTTTEVNVTTTVKTDLKVKKSEYRTYRSAMDDLANGDQGFDWTIMWTRDSATETYHRRLRIGQPQLGALSSPDSNTFDYPGNIFNFWETDSCSDAATNLTMTGVGSGDKTLTKQTFRQDLIDSGYCRFDLTMSTKATTTQKMVDALASQMAKEHVLPINTIVAQVKGDASPEFGTYQLGDACSLVLDGPWHPTVMKKSTRIIGWDYTPADQDNVEQVQLVFEGVQATE